MKSKTYEEFVDKFKPKLTTDDCYTPPLIYDTVRDWACREYGIDPGSIVRPFWPGGDYERFDYPDGCTVLDNPPFSILSKICEFYLDRGIAFFLFAPSLTAFSGKNVAMRMNHLICDANIEYENGAIVRTAFVTSYGGDVIAQTAPTLGRAINDAVEQLRKEKTRSLPKYTYPDNIVTAAILQRWAHYGIDFQVRRGECARVSKLDAQRESGKAIFGSGLLLSSQKAAERAAAERAAAERAAARGLPPTSGSFQTGSWPSWPAWDNAPDLAARGRAGIASAARQAGDGQAHLTKSICPCAAGRFVYMPQPPQSGGADGCKTRCGTSLS